MTFERLFIVRALSRVKFVDDTALKLSVPLELNRPLTPFEVSLFAEEGIQAEGAVIRIEVDKVDEMKLNVEDWKDLVGDVSRRSADRQRIEQATARNREDLLRQANAETEYLRFN